MRSFPFGLAALCILLLALTSGLWLTLHPVPPRTGTLTVWTFAKAHYDTYLKAIPAFEAKHPGVKVQLQLVANNSLANRLQAAFMADLGVPDMVEIEISQAGAFFRGRLKDVGFLDLTERLRRSGLYDRMVQARFAPYTKQGHIFGLPHDVHPVMLAYNRELFEKLGIDPNKIETWDDFIREGRRVTVPGRRYMIELSDSGRDQLEPILFQRGGGYFDKDGNLIFDNEVSVETLIWYVPLVAGDKRIGFHLGGGSVLTQAVEDGRFLCLVAPDWRSKSIENDIKSMSGKMALMPFPAVRPGGPRTTTWGGTMLGITQRCADPDLAWALAQHLYLDKEDLAQRFLDNNILPCMKEAWNHPSYDLPRPYWSNQPLGRLYASLAPSVPFQYTSPFIQTAKEKYSQAIVASVQYYKQNGEAGFEAFCRAELKRRADQVRKLIARNPY